MIHPLYPGPIPQAGLGARTSVSAVNRQKARRSSSVGGPQGWCWAQGATQGWLKKEGAEAGEMTDGKVEGYPLEGARTVAKLES